MALIKCPECGNEHVSDCARTCPVCGFAINEYYLKTRELRQQLIFTLKNIQLMQVLAEEEQKQKKLLEKEQRIEKVKMPDMPDKKKSIKEGVLLLLIPAFLAVFFLTVEWYFLFTITCIFILILVAGIISSYKFETERYTSAQEDFRAYQEKIIEMEDSNKEYVDKLDRDKLRRETNKRNTTVSCPKCGSTSIATINRGYSIVWGFVGSGNPMNVCQKCGYKFKPGKN